MLYIQARIVRENFETVVWIEKKKNLRVGSQVVLMPENTVWRVVDLYSQKDKKYIDNKLSWNSNFGESLRQEDKLSSMKR